MCIGISGPERGLSYLCFFRRLTNNFCDGLPFIKLLIDAASWNWKPAYRIPELGITFFAGNIIGLLIIVILQLI